MKYPWRFAFRVALSLVVTALIVTFYSTVADHLGLGRTRLIFVIGLSVFTWWVAYRIGVLGGDGD